ncbi:pirin family protein [Luteococcus sp.]|uniref:pirin family protein n=1 Tax=Luteococcus sp. TaxID=1969402 RepID=UPI0037365AA0
MLRRPHGPADVTEGASIDVGPHPHIGLQTVTWLLDGQVLHRDSLGSEQVVRPGQLNLMTSGDGVTHSEEATGHYRGRLEGIRLWVALPERTRRGGAAFEHLTELPRLDLRADGRQTGEATVLVVLGGEVRIETIEPARLVLIGGTPMPEPISMWWNFVARNRQEIDEAYRAWRDREREGRFGQVDSPLPTIEAPAPPWWRAGEA